MNPGTNLTITGPTAGGDGTIMAPPMSTAGETVAAYATALQSRRDRRRESSGVTGDSGCGGGAD